MSGIDLGGILVNASIVTVGVGSAIFILGHGCSLIGRRLAHARETQTTALIPESPEEVLLFSSKPNYSALRNRTKELQADEAARAG
jgi:hypothetical protein